MNANIMNTHIFHLIENDLKDHWRSLYKFCVKV